MLTVKAGLIVGVLCACTGLFTNPGIHAMTVDEATGMWGAQSGGTWFTYKECVADDADWICNLMFSSGCSSAGAVCSECAPPPTTQVTSCVSREYLVLCFKALNPPDANCGNEWEGTCTLEGGVLSCDNLEDCGTECNDGGLTNACRQT